MAKKRRKHSEEFKARVALEAVKGVKTLSELSATYGIHPTVIAQWKRQLLDGAPDIFSRKNGINHRRGEEELTAPLYEEIGRLKMEVDWLKKKL
jgi:transposase-like protein